MAMLITGGRIVTAIDSYPGSVLIEDGRVAAIGADVRPPAGAEIVNATGMLVLPGIIDVHVHVGLDLKGHLSSDYPTTTREAAFGGVTSILTYATPEIGQTLSDAVEEERDRAEGHSYVDCGLHASLVHWQDRDDDEIAQMVEIGVPSFKAYTVYSEAGLMSEDEELYRALLAVGRAKGLLTVHCENEWMIDSKIRRLAQEKKLAPSDHAASRPSYVEGEAVSAVIRAAYDAGTPVYIVHVSTMEALEAIDEADGLGIDVYSETCPHFLLLSEEKLAGKNGQRYATCPPLRPKAHQAELWDGLSEGIIQVVSTDHCEFRAADKDAGASDFRKIPMGLPGVGTLLPLMWHFGVGEGRLTENELVDRLATQPSEIFGLSPQKGALVPGSDADLVILDPSLAVTMKPAALHGHADYSPYDGWRVKGWPVSTMVRGEWVVKDRELVGSPEHGQFIQRGRVCQRPGGR